MATFLTLYTAVTDALGRADTLGVTLAKRGVNFGQLLAALFFDPVTLKTTGTLTASSTSTSLSTLTKLRLINSIFNTTGGVPVNFVPEEKFNLIVPSGLTYIEYYYRHGGTIYHNSPSASNSLAVKYTIFPTELSGDSDACALTEYDSFIVAAGTNYAFASLEETESQTIWDKVLATYTTSFQLNAKQLTEYKEALRASGHDI